MTIAHLKKQLQTLLLAHSAQTIEQHLERVKDQTCSIEQFLSDLLAEEISHRKVKRIEGRIRQAQIPLIKSIDNFDFCFPKKIPKQLILSCLSGEYIRQKKKSHFFGCARRWQNASGHRIRASGLSE